jgi:hypothetical protein
LKANPLNLLIAILAGALLAYALWNLAGADTQGAIALGSFVFLASALACSAGLRYRDERAGRSVKLLGSVFFVVALLLNVFFAVTRFSTTVYVVVSGLVFLLFLFLANAVHGAEQA